MSVLIYFVLISFYLIKIKETEFYCILQITDVLWKASSVCVQICAGGRISVGNENLLKNNYIAI